MTDRITMKDVVTWEVLKLEGNCGTSWRKTSPQKDHLDPEDGEITFIGAGFLVKPTQVYNPYEGTTSVIYQDEGTRWRHNPYGLMWDHP